LDLKKGGKEFRTPKKLGIGGLGGSKLWNWGYPKGLNIFSFSPQRVLGEGED